MFLLCTHLLQSACCSLDSSPEMCFTDCTHLLHVCDDISHLQSKLIVLLFLIGKQNHCLCCVCVCGGGWGVGGSRRNGKRKEEGGEGRNEEEWEKWEEGGKEEKCKGGRGSIRITFQIKEMSHLEMYYIQT